MKIVLALGGNALQSNPKDKSAEAQLKTCKETAKSIVDLLQDGHSISIVHGNGPQVGQILQSIETAHKANEANNLLPFDVCGAFSQGYIGYHLQNAIKEELSHRGIEKNVGTVITQVVVDKDDNGFKNPTKPIGSFYSKEESENLTKNEGYIMKEDAGRGYRRVVASPKPVDIVEKDLIKKLVEDDYIVISCGGGGIPVVDENGDKIGVEAVIDKDFAAEKLAEVLEADALLILTAIDRVCINFNKPDQKELDVINLEELNKYIEEGHFMPGSMLPKVEACKKFVLSGENKMSIIASLDKAREALKGCSGTKIIKG
ncbi:carbamate kinase [Clostridium collagenovorans DSM 3089]|uniref:Carbamate kinase n=1 Tax=Clostridium collagenovorans DSM 3089 TaxID=1121306 RepID=A0A1M5WM43_9CLOT|nr:carbamate kinase [Clostridium collagenovorans]SHH88073.1 carbamate kinase [Clostridium collagenovorans DSM 3089]